MIFNPCNPIDTQSDVLALEDWLTDAFMAMAQYDYPYPSSASAKLPAFPVNVTCSIMSQHMQTENMWQTLQGFAFVANLYYNSTGVNRCNDYYISHSDYGGPWHYQTCTELILPVGQYGLPGDMFPSRPWNLTQWSNECQSVFGTGPRMDWYPIDYGMTANINTTLKYSSNIVFSYGTLDPWSGGCLQDQVNLNTLVLPILKGAHNIDLRSPSPRDPISVVFSRSKEISMINQWIASSSKLPSFNYN